MATKSESKWCPECEGWYEHLDGFCIGCDLPPEHWEGKAPQDVDVQAALGEKDWSKEKWVVVKSDPMFASDTKKSATEILSKELGEDDVSTIRLEAGLYYYEGDEDSDNEFYIGRPDVLSENDLL